MKLRSGVFCGALLALLTFGASAGEKALMKALQEREGKRATVVLNSGVEMTGVVASVSDDAVRLSELSGREFFDAVIDLDKVQAVVVRVRDK